MATKNGSNSTAKNSAPAKKKAPAKKVIPDKQVVLAKKAVSANKATRASSPALNAAHLQSASTRGDHDVQSFLDPTRILLFGKKFSGLSVDRTEISKDTPQNAAASPLMATVQKLRASKETSIARIYSFSYEGYYQKLPWPMLFVVSGEGAPLGDAPSIAMGGVDSRDWIFASDIVAWEVDRHDIAICLDLLIAKFDDLLLGPDSLVQDDATGRGGVASRSASASRSATAFRSATTFRSAAAFRSAMMGPHQDR